MFVRPLAAILAITASSIPSSRHRTCQALNHQLLRYLGAIHAAGLLATAPLETVPSNAVSRKIRYAVVGVGWFAQAAAMPDFD